MRDIGYQTRVRIDGSGPAVVLVHGTPLELGAWDRLVELLRSDVRLVRYDLRGHGSAAGEPLLASYHVLAADLRRLLDCYGIERAHVVGHSFGGQVAARFGRDYSDRLESLTTVCSRWTPFPAFAEAADRIEAGGYSAIVQGIMKRWFTEATLRREPYAVRYARKAFQRADQRSFATALRMISRFDGRRDLRAINTTVRIIAAQRDHVVTAPDLLSVAARVPNCSLTVVRDANHLLPLEHPDRLAELLRDGVQA